VSVSMPSAGDFASNHTDERSRILQRIRTALQWWARGRLAAICWSFFSLIPFSALAAETDLHPSDLYGGVESLEFSVIVDSEAVRPDRKTQLEHLSIRRYMQECLRTSAYRRLLLPATTGEVPRPDIMPVTARKGPTNFSNLLWLLLRLRIEDNEIPGTSTVITTVTYDIELVRQRTNGWYSLLYQPPTAFVAADSEEALLAQFNELCEKGAREPATQLRS
jgi:hypothetical protein